jgi:hypothetical protein
MKRVGVAAMVLAAAAVASATPAVTAHRRHAIDDGTIDARSTMAGYSSAATAARSSPPRRKTS